MTRYDRNQKNEKSRTKTRSKFLPPSYPSYPSFWYSDIAVFWRHRRQGAESRHLLNNQGWCDNVW
jgi:hypothetical protein